MAGKKNDKMDMYDLTVLDCTQEQKIAHTFRPSFDNANGHLYQEWFLRSRNFVTMVAWRHISLFVVTLFERSH